MNQNSIGSITEICFELKMFVKMFRIYDSVCLSEIIYTYSFIDTYNI